MPEQMIQSFIKLFSRLPQRVVWQWKGKPRSDLPSNVLAIPWLPQQDLLGWINQSINTITIAKLFITKVTRAAVRL